MVTGTAKTIADNATKKATKKVTGTAKTIADDANKKQPRWSLAPPRR